MNTHAQIVASAEYRQKTIRIGKQKKTTDTVFFNGMVVLHHVKSSCLKRVSKRSIHRGMLKAFLHAEIGIRCSGCWTDRKWNKALNPSTPKSYEREVRSDAVLGPSEAERAPDLGDTSAHEPPRSGKPRKRKKKQPIPGQRRLLDWFRKS